MVQVFGEKMLDLAAKHSCSQPISEHTGGNSETSVFRLFVGSCAVGIHDQKKKLLLTHSLFAEVMDGTGMMKTNAELYLHYSAFSASCIVSMPLCSKCSNTKESGCA